MRASKRLVTWYGILICAAAGAFYAYEFVLRVLPGALQTELMTAFGNVSAGVFGQISALYYFAYSPMQLPVGILMDRYGPRKVLSFACFLCAIGSWFFVQTPHLWLVGVGRFLVGLGSAFAFVGMLLLGHHWLPRRFFSLLAGLVTTFAMLSLMFGVIKMTAFAAVVGYLSILKFFAIFGLVLSIVMYCIVRDTPQGKVVVHQQSWQLFFKEVWLVLWNPSVWFVGTVGALLYTALSVFGELWGKTYLEQAHHLTSMEAATAVSSIFLGWAIGAPVVGYLSDHSGYRFSPLFWGAFLGAISISVVLYVPGLSWWSISICLFLYGIFTASEIIVFVMGKELCEAKLAGTVFAAVNMIVMLGGMILQPLVGYALDWHAARNAHLLNGHYVYLASDYRFALSFLPVALVIAMGLLIRFKSSPRCR